MEIGCVGGVLEGLRTGNVILATVGFTVLCADGMARWLGDFFLSMDELREKVLQETQYPSH